MNIARTATSLPLLLAAFSPLSLSPALAAPAPDAGLTFRVSARVGANSGPQQLVQARVSLRGRAARIETTTAGTPAVVLFTPPYLYRLLPRSKAGVRWKLDASRPSNVTAFDPQTLLRDPSSLKVALVRGGAKRIGVARLNGTPVEIYQGSNLGGRGQRAKVWLRRSDSLPLRLEASGSQLQIVASWSDYARPRLPAALFSAPKEFRVREVAGQPPFSIL